MDITPGQWALIAGVVVLILIHVATFVTIRRVKSKIKELEKKGK